MELSAERDRVLPLWPLVAVAGALTCGTALLQHGLTVEGAHVATLVLLVSAAALTDLRRGTIPNGLNGLGALCGVAFALGGGSGTLATAVQGGLAAGLFLLAVRAFGYLAVRQPGMGYGDVKLAVVLGLFLGWGGLWALYLGVVVAGLFGVVGIAAGVVDRRQRIPFAPFIAAGVLLHLFVLPLERLLAWL